VAQLYRGGYRMRKIFSLYVVMFLMVFPSLVHAANHTATSTGDWDDPAIWDLASVPGSGDTVEIPIDQGTGGVSINSGVDAAAQSVRLAIKDGLLTMNGGNLTLTDGLWGQKTGTQVIFAQSGTITGDVGANDPLGKKLAHINVNGGVTATIDGDVQTPYIRLPGSGIEQTFRLGAGRTLTGDIRVGSSGGGFAGNQGTVEFLGTATVNGNIGEVWSGRLKQLTLNSGDVSVVGDVRSESYDLKGSTLALTGTGNITQVDSGTIWTQVSNATSYGKITATGAATIPVTATVSVDVLGYVPAGSVLTIVDGNGGTGVDADIPVVTNSAVVSFTSDSAASEDLTITSSRTSSYNNIATNSKTSAVGSVLESIGAAGATGDMLTVLNALDSLPTAGAVEQALEALIPVVDAGTMTVLYSALNQFINTSIVRIANAFPQKSTAGTGIATGGDYLKDLEIWAQGFGDYAHQDERGLSNGYNATVWGTAVGCDVPTYYDNVKLGVSGGFAQSFVRSKDSSGRTDIDSYQVTLSGGYQDKEYPYYLDCAFSFAYNTYDSSRHITLGAIDRTALSDYNGQQYSALVDFGYTFDVHKLKFTPMASVQYMHLRVGGYTERDAGSLNLKVDSQDYDMLQTGFGAKFEYPLESKYGTFTPEIHAKWLYDFIGDKQQTTSTFSGGGGSFATNGFKPAQSTYDFGTKVSLITKNDVTLGVEYDFQIKEDYWEHTGWVNVSYKL
jgi:uncharacterized protein with beta-barrel porin domain